MSLPSPQLDDRTFRQLLDEAHVRMAGKCPEWGALSPQEPEKVLLEAFAHLTEMMLHRLNRLPDKAYVEFLRLLGVRLQPPSAASVSLRFSLEAPAGHPVDIPRGTRVATVRAEAGPEPVVFSTAEAVRILPGASEVRVLAYHCEHVEADLVGYGTGQPGLTVRLGRPPVVAPTGDGLDVVVGVEAEPGELDARAPARRHEGRLYRVWWEVEDFAYLAPNEPAYRVDRATGTLSFAPAARILGDEGALGEARALAAVPPAGRAIRVWYRRGGGTLGNVTAHSLEVLEEPLPGVKVTNPRPAMGGRAAETLENALVRGPMERHSLRRAITAGDFELLALRASSAVARAKAFTLAQSWVHAAPGTVQVLLVPHLPPELQGCHGEGVTAGRLRRHQSEEVRAQVQRELEARRPLGTEVQVSWARYKTVSVVARVVAQPTQDAEALKLRLLERLYRTLSPLSSTVHPGGWGFGQPLRTAQVRDVFLSEPGVRSVERVRVRVDEVPREVRTLAADASQPHTFYAGADELLFRTGNAGEGWEAVGRFSGEQVDGVEAHPSRAGWVAVVSRPRGGMPSHSRVALSRDCCETWEPGTATLEGVKDLAWTVREDTPVLLLATVTGLFEWVMRPGALPRPVLVDPSHPRLGFCAVAATPDAGGGMCVAVAAMDRAGVLLSDREGRPGTFWHLGLRGQDVRVLEVQREGARAFLWAGLGADPEDGTGQGAMCWELSGGEPPPGGWRGFGQGWEGGTCLSLAFAGATVYAGTQEAGVLSLAGGTAEAVWRRPEAGVFPPVQALALQKGGLPLLSGGPQGVSRRTAEGGSDVPCSQREFSEEVTVPPTWLLCSGFHEVDVGGEDEEC
ncbi:putative baseplate assembly protein [Stigmatella aurantiaca]|uniref:Putative baseplate assembly protein n=1 Tax=Stigmatella aurantiaca TaxID=41 RepID=A0A1H7Z694_STIAU|nr:putative baseplate assembly protein [Stigmatella aurantiaca]SEM53068.1 putative baseplate assembly protein [Stigmatella aurantiaca]